MKAKKHILESIHHFIVGFFLILKGYDKMAHHQLIGGVILAFGGIILIYFLYEMLAKKQSRTLKILVHLFEAIALLFTTYIFFKDGKTYLQYFTLAAAIGFFISVIVLFRKGRITNTGLN